MASVKLRTEIFDDITKGLTDLEISKKMGISTTQLWRVRLPDNDPRHNDPGTDFIAGALRAFPDRKFEELFFLAEIFRPRKELYTGTDG